MTLRERIQEMIEPRNESIVSKAYDWVMLGAIIIGLLPLMFRSQPRLFWYFDIVSGIVTAGYIEELEGRKSKEKRSDS